MSDVRRQSVPLPVRLVVILLWISVVILAIAGVVLLFTSGADVYTDEGISQGVVIFWGLEALIVALIYAAVARGLSRGANSARVVVAVVAGIHIVFGIWQLITGANEPGAIVGILFQLLIIGLLYGPQSSKDHFAPYSG